LAAAGCTSGRQPLSEFGSGHRLVGDIYHVAGPGQTCGSHATNHEVFGNYVIDTGAGLAIVDADGKSNFGPNLRRLGFDVSQVRWILATHMHSDHASEFNNLVAASGARVLASAFTARHLRQGGDGWSCYWGGDLVVGKTEVHQVLTLGNKQIRVVATPGHTLGSTSYYLRESQDGRQWGVLFSGDFLHGIWDGHKYADYDKQAASLKKILDLHRRTPVDILAGGHLCRVLPRSSFDDLVAEEMTRNTHSKNRYDCFRLKCPSALPLYPTGPCPKIKDNKPFCELHPECSCCNSE
jgi:glyoxylase-like metal-dependent hydrolase (beta-lactamase superfamily II)